MAYAALVSLSQTIDEILNRYGDSISQNQKRQIISIDKFVISLQAFLEYFPERVNTDLEGKIRDVSTEAEVVIEYFMWEQFETSNRHWWRRHDLDELKRVAKKFDSIAGEVMNIKDSFRTKDIRTTVDSPAAAGSASSSSSSLRIAPSHKKEAMVGFEGDLLAIKERLCGDRSSKLQVIPIVGMGGIGKTTLARSAYDAPLTMQHFDIRAWVTLSQDYSAQKVFSELLHSMKEFDTGRSDQSDDERVYKVLMGRKYLIVMDDMWSTEAWDDVRRIFPDGNNGSRILLTSRLLHVAAYAGSSSRVHEMHLMDADQSWDLLRHRVFSHEEECPFWLENIGKKIAGMCRGLPLAIVVIAGLLSMRKTRVSWEEIAENVKSAISATKDEQFAKILSLSYTNLPHHLRPCFLYMGAFPEDYEINASKLFMLWVAEGFLKYTSGSKSYEEVAEEYLEDLVKRSLVLVTRMKSNGKIKSCSVHDLLRDLCIKTAKEVRLITLVNKSFGGINLKSIKYQRRICITHSDLIFPACIGNPTEILRTIICFQSRSTSNSLGRLGNFILLRILDVLDTYVKSLPVEVFKLFRLRYLAFCSNEEIPADISNLQNLQTLIINPSDTLFSFGYSQSRELVYLPEEIWKMRQLRHLVSSLSVPVMFLEEYTRALENLVSLKISVDIKVGTVGMFKMIPNLKKLNISYFDEGYGTDDYHLDELVHLHQLENLKLCRPSSHRGKFEPAFPKTLKKLTLSGWSVPWDEDVTSNIGLLPNLQVLKLRYWVFHSKKWETREGEFSQLKLLLIKSSNLKEWITESSHFPTLKCLMLHRCRYLKEIPDGIGEIPTLELIEINSWGNVNVSLVESAKRIQKEQQDFGNDALQVLCFD